MYLAAGVAQRAAGPVRLPLMVTNAKCHDGATVVQIQPDPVPAVSGAIEVLARPLVIEPGLAADAIAARGAHDVAADAQVRLAVVVAGRLRCRSLLAVTCDAVEKHWLCDLEAQIQSEVLSGNLRLVAAVAALKPPVVNPDQGIAA